MKGKVVVGLVIVTIVFLISLVEGHSEQFHRLPLHPKHFAQNHPSQYDRILEKLRQKQEGNHLNAKAENKYLKNIKQITNQGTNAEAYWSFDG